MMTRTLLVFLLLALQFSISNADTVVDVFDGSLEDQLMNPHTTEIELLLGSIKTSDKAESVDRGSRQRFFPASYRIGTNFNASLDYWTAGKYPAAMIDAKSIVAADEDKHFFYFASDLMESAAGPVELEKSVTEFTDEIQADHDLKKLPGRQAR